MTNRVKVKQKKELLFAMNEPNNHKVIELTSDALHSTEQLLLVHTEEIIAVGCPEKLL